MQAHFIASGTRHAQEYLDNCPLHGANMFTGQGMGQGPRILALRARAVYRESQLGRAIIVIVIVIVFDRITEKTERKRDEQREREKNRDIWDETDTWEKRERDTRRDRETREERERWESEGSDYLQNAPLCTFKTPVSRTHGSVFQWKTRRNAHTYTQPHPQPPPQLQLQTQQDAQPNHNTHNTHNHRQHTVHWEERGEMKKRERHVKREHRWKESETERHVKKDEH